MTRPFEREVASVRASEPFSVSCSEDNPQPIVTWVALAIIKRLQTRPHQFSHFGRPELTEPVRRLNSGAQLVG
jgi:hypothetical protein